MAETPDQSKPGPPAEPPGTTFRSIPKEWVQRAAQGFRALMRGPGQFTTLKDAPPPQPTLRPTAEPEVPPSTMAARPLDTGYMGPGIPQPPAQAPWQDVAGRAFDYGPGYNTETTPRASEGITFQQLRNLAENYDLLRLAIETRKNQMAKIGWSIMPKKEPGQSFRPKADMACRMVEDCLKRPDGIHSWDQWIRMVCEDSFVCDGVALFRRRHPDGKPYALEVVDPATIKILIDVTGRSPLPPQPAYAQMIKGMPVAHYTRNEMTYWKRNPRSNKVYGFSEVEQVVRTTVLGVARLTRQLGHYSDGNVPDAMLPMPANWTMPQIREFEQFFNSLMTNPRQKRRMHPIPGGVGAPIMLNTEQALFGPFDEWLARMICYAFSLPPFPFVQQTNRATAQSQYDSALEEGLAPFLAAIKAFMDHEIADFFGQPNLELVWDDVRKLDPTEQANQDQVDIKSGLASLDDVRAKRGQDPSGLDEPLIFGVGPMGFLTAKQVKDLVASGENMPPSPEEMAMMNGMGGAPGGDPLADADPELLAQLGIDPGAVGQPGEAGGGAEPGGAGAAPAGGVVAAVARQMKTPPEALAVLRRVTGGGAGPKDDKEPEDDRDDPKPPGARHLGRGQGADEDGGDGGRRGGRGGRPGRPGAQGDRDG